MTSKRRAGGRTASVPSPPEVADRSERTLWFLHATMVYLRLGRIAEAHRFAQEHDALASPPVAAPPRPRRRRDAADADRGRQLGRARAASPPGVEAASIANADTLCDMNWRSLLMAALALRPARR